MPKPRARELGLLAFELSAGPLDSITDVPGVRVGHTTLISGEGPLRPGRGPVRTGVTVILPHGGDLFAGKVRAAVHTINGFGKATGFEEVRELGVIEAPVALTNTLNVGLVTDALVQYAIAQTPMIGIDTHTVNVVVGETNDGYLNDLQGRHVRAQHVMAALAAARGGPVAEGAVGAGAGTTCFGWKGGIGCASRLLPPEGGRFVVGALVQSNFGRAEALTIGGYPVGRYLRPPPPANAGAAAPAGDFREPGAGGGQPGPGEGPGSVMVVLATDAPLDSRQLHRLCVRAAAGLARTGSHFGHGSGDFVIAFTTADPVLERPPQLTALQTVLADEPRAMYWLLPAVAECVEEAVFNSLLQAETMTGRDDHIRYALPVERVLELLGDRSRAQ